MVAKRLDVIDRGSFFDDAFFRESWSDFDRAMKDVLDRFDAEPVKDSPLSPDQCREKYRRLRRDAIEDDLYASQALQVTQKDGAFQAVMDVRDFNPRNLQVRVRDNNVIIEGRYDKASEDGSSKSSKSFYKEITLPPQADVDMVSTALSKDGILTIKAPKKDCPDDGLGSSRVESSKSQSVEESFKEENAGDAHSSCRFKTSSSSKVFKSSSSSSSETSDGMLGSLPRDLRDRLMWSDCSSSSSLASSSPASPRGGDGRVSTTMEFNLDRSSNPIQKSEVSFKVGAPPPPPPPPPPSSGSSAQQSSSSRPTPRQASGASGEQPACGLPPSVVGSGGSKAVLVTEEDGRRVRTAEASNLLQEEDGFVETKETEAEITEKDSQTARREALTRVRRGAEDPGGRFGRSEATDSSDVSESCVKQMPDGSYVTMNKSCRSSSSTKKSFSSSGGGDDFPFAESAFPSDFQRDLESFFGDRGGRPSLMSRLSGDSLGSSFASRSPFADASSDFPSPSFPLTSGFADLPGFSKFPSGVAANSPRFHASSSASPSSTSAMDFPSTRSSVSSRTTKSSFSTSSYSSSFDNVKF